MKNTSLTRYSSIAFMAGVLLFGACRKENKQIETDPAQTQESGQSSTDNRDVQSENDAAVNDMNNVISDHHNLSGSKTTAQAGLSGVTGTVCGLSVDTSGMSNGTVLLNYNGTTCNNRTRSGSIRVTILDYANGRRWKQAGCTVKLEYLSYKVVRASDQKSIQLDGTQYVKNESGNTWWELLIVKTQSSLVSSVTGTDLHVKFNDGKTAVYNINRRITYTFPNNLLTCKAEGIGSSGGLNNLENYGTTRDGDAFTSQVSTPLVWNLTCGWWAPVEGKVVIKVATKSFELKGTFGVDVNGQPVQVGANQCPYGWRMDWTVDNQSYSKAYAYL